MAQAKQLKHFIQNLEDLIVEEGWQEHTGPFFYIKIKGANSLGPIRAVDLQAYIAENSLPSTTMVRDAKNTQDWVNIYSHPYFQRRKPSLVHPSSSKTDYTFYYLKNGKPTGPINSLDFETLVNEKSLIPTDMVSVDEGKTWIKLYQLSNFDRRSYSASELPVSPEQGKGKFTKPSALKKIMNQTEALVSLTFTRERKKTTSHSEEKEGSSLKLILIILAVLAFAFYVTTGDAPSKKTKAKKLAPSTTTQTPTKKTVKAKKVKVAPAKRAPRANLKAKTPPKRKPTSFTSTPVYKNRKKLEDNALVEEEQYYDDGFDAVELDPVRKAVSKETFDPDAVRPPEEDSYIEEDVYLDKEEFDAGDSEIITVEDVWDDGSNQDDGGKDPFEDEAQYYE